ncbi:MAG: cyclic 2,3-diphosphoglycerate synthase [Acidimicrobiia bacterium]
MRRVIVMGAGGRDFHVFATVFRADPRVEVVAFTAAQIPGIDDRRFPASMAGDRYPAGIPVRPEVELDDLIRAHDVDEVVLAYSDLAHEDVMHKASRAMATGADFRLVGPKASMLRSSKPVVAICAVRTGCGKSQTTRRVAQLLIEQGVRPVLVRHPMPYGDLDRMRVQRFASLEDIDEADATVEEREEYEAPVRMGMVMYAGVDYEAILRRAEAEADVVVWDGGNNDLPFYVPDLLITVVDPLRPGHELSHHPGEVNLRLADVVLVNKVDRAAQAAVEAVLANVAAVNPGATVVRAESPVTLLDGPDLAAARVLVVEDGPSVTHGGMPYGAGTVAAEQAGAGTIVDPRDHAVGSIRDVYDAYPHLGPVLPAMGYGADQLADLEATIEATPCDVVVAGTPVDLAALVSVSHPIRRAAYELREVGRPHLADVLAPIIARVKGG